MKINLCARMIITIISLILLTWGLNYVLISAKHTNATDTLPDSIYFTTTMLSTVGYGDIVPITRTGKIVVALQQMAIFLLAIGFFTISCD